MKLKIEKDDKVFEVGFVWGTGAFIATCDALDKEFGEVQLGITDPKIFMTLVYHAMLIYIDKHNIDLELNFRDFLIVYDSQDSETLNNVTNDYLDNFYQGKTMRQYYEDFGFTFKDSEDSKGAAKKKTHQSQRYTQTSYRGGSRSKKRKKQQ